MIIKIIPENEEDKKKIRESEHGGVTDFFVCGIKKDGDGDAVDFHEWSGKYPKLIGPLFYYAHFLVNEQNVKNNALRTTESFTPPTPQKAPFIKRSKPEDGQVKQLVSAEDMAKMVEQGNNSIKFPQPSQNVIVNETPFGGQPNAPVSPPQAEELPVEEPPADDESKGAEDN